MSTKLDLYGAVCALAATTIALDEPTLDHPAWRYDALPAYDGVRYALLHTTLELRRLAAHLHAARQRTGPPVTAAQRALAAHQAAFRDFEAMLLDVDASAYVATPAPQAWPINVIVVHVHLVERFFLAAILNALRSDDPQPPTVAEITAEIAAQMEEPVVPDLAAAPDRAWQAFARLHGAVQAHLVDLADAQLLRLSPAWEDAPLPTVEFRLYRFDSHLREHTNQLEKSLGWLARPPHEAKLLLRQLFAALAEVEGVCIGAPDLGATELAEQTARIQARSVSLTDTLAEIRAMAAAVESLDAARIAAHITANRALAYTQVADRQSALLFALYNGRHDIVSALLASGMHLTLHEAAAVGDTARLRERVEAWQPGVNEFARDGFTPLQLACFFAHPDCVQLLLAAGADVTAVARNAMRIQPLHAAVAWRSAAIVQLLVAAAADVNARQQDEFTPLMAARQHQDAEIEAILVAAGAT